MLEITGRRRAIHVAVYVCSVLLSSLAVESIAACSPDPVRASGPSVASFELPSLVPPLRLREIERGIHPAWMRSASTSVGQGELTYVGERLADTINAYATKNRENSGPVCQISAKGYHPLGMATDKKGRLYVSGTISFSNDGVAAFGPNCGPAGQVYFDSYESVDPVVDRDLLYVTDISEGSPSAPVKILIYKVDGDGSPIRELSYPPVTSAIGVAVDSQHNLFWSNNVPEAGQIIEFPKGKMPGKILKATKIGRDYPGGVMVDASDNLLLIDQTQSTLNVYVPPYTAPASSIIPLKGWEVYCAFGLHKRRFYCMDYKYGSVDAYAYPGGKYLYSYDNGIDQSADPIGIAIQRPVSGSGSE